ncbi:hypothetical protein G7068_13630 [Leucobacter viscericola]|uniref:Uncharacterized protein n=1 Tax=Leucobacter viscericola TaxID=2714935 RepID=A0A6G7XI48_9MICO|nr:hypothetical protein [Leucobacter viscericola]QIK64119.1 hypothetical protein G7068_13630 [Leucobacter viscericola]
MSKHTPKAVLRDLEGRDGHVSAWTGEDCPELVPQHRQGGMGGRKDKHRGSNVVWLESLINGLIESDPEFQAEAIRRGIKISLHADPTEVPIEHAVHGFVKLTDDWKVTEVT